jgi:hypothetical protein
LNDSLKKSKSKEQIKILDDISFLQIMSAFCDKNIFEEAYRGHEVRGVLRQASWVLQNACKFLTLYKHACKYITKNRAGLYRINQGVIGNMLANTLRTLKDK